MKKRIGMRGGESGNALVTALVVLFAGSVIVLPLLTLIDTGIGATQIKEEQMKEFYAAASGIEDAVNKIRMHDPAHGVDFSLPESTGGQLGYTLGSTINGKAVDVTVENIWLLDGVKSEPASHPPYDDPDQQEIVVMGSTIEIDGSERWYRVDLACHLDALKSLPVSRVAVWLPAGFEYVAGSTQGITENNPAQVDHHGGTILQWNFSPAMPFLNFPVPGLEDPPITVPLRRALAFKFTPGKDPRGSFSWLTTTNDSYSLYWDEACKTYKVNSTSSGETAESYVSRGRLSDRVNPSNGDYRALGNTLMEDADSNGIRDGIIATSSCSIEKVEDPDQTEMPMDATILLAYLYWSSWYDPNADPAHLPQVTGPVTEVSFQIDVGVTPGTPETVFADTVSDETINESGSLPGGYPFNGNAYNTTHIYVGKADVTSQVQEMSMPGAERFTVTVGGAEGTLDSNWSYAGWSLLLVYSSHDEDSHQLYLYDTMTYGAEQSDNYFTMEGFEVPGTPNGVAKLTYFIGEGDDHLSDDYIRVQGGNDGGWHSWSSQLDDGYGDANDVLNGKSIALGGFIDGVDIDTYILSDYDEDPPEDWIIEAGDKKAQVRLKTGSDSWTLVYMMLSFRSVVDDPWYPYPVGIITYGNG